MMLKRLWPSYHLMITVDTPETAQGVLAPQHQLRFLNEVAELTARDPFATSLVYSTPQGNTGWTAFRFGETGHVAYHHWDAAHPGLLQLDLMGHELVDPIFAIRRVTDFWGVEGVRAFTIRRSHPAEPASKPQLICDSLKQRSRDETGLGPGDHMHAILDFQGRVVGGPNPSQERFDTALSRLVSAMGMRGLTPPMSVSQTGVGFSYDAIMGITTSHVNLRWRQSNDGVMLSAEAFSCRDFDAEILVQWIRDMGCIGKEHLIAYNRHPGGMFLDY